MKLALTSFSRGRAISPHEERGSLQSPCPAGHSPDSHHKCSRCHHHCSPCHHHGLSNHHYLQCWTRRRSRRRRRTQGSRRMHPSCW